MRESYTPDDMDCVEFTVETDWQDGNRIRIILRGGVCSRPDEYLQETIRNYYYSDRGNECFWFAIMTISIVMGCFFAGIVPDVAGRNGMLISAAVAVVSFVIGAYFHRKESSMEEKFSLDDEIDKAKQRLISKYKVHKINQSAARLRKNELNKLMTKHAGSTYIKTDD